MDFITHVKQAALRGEKEVWLQKDIIALKYGCTCDFEAKLIPILLEHKLRVIFMWGLGKEKASVLRFRPFA